MRVAIVATVVCLLAMTSFASVEGASLTVSTATPYINVLRSGSVPFTATVGNLAGAGDSLDWTIDNNLTYGLRLSGSGLALPAGSSINVTGSFGADFYGTYEVTAQATGANSTLGGPANNSPAISTPITMNVGLATAADSGVNNTHAFIAANALYAVVPNGGNYAGLASQTQGAGVLGSEAVILAGSNSTGADQTVSMNWRTLSQSEVWPTFTTPPISWEEYGMAGDVVNLTGLDGSTFVLQMSYNTSVMHFDLGLGRDLDWYAANGYIYLGWLDPSDGIWKNAVIGNHGGTSTFMGVGAYDDDLTLGHWGVDTENGVVWAVLDHNSQFTPSPEPATMALLAVGGVAMLARRRK